MKKYKLVPEKLEYKLTKIIKELPEDVFFQLWENVCQNLNWDQEVYILDEEWIDSIFPQDRMKAIYFSFNVDINLNDKYVSDSLNMGRNWQSTNDLDLWQKYCDKGKMQDLCQELFENWGKYYKEFPMFPWDEIYDLHYNIQEN